MWMDTGPTSTTADDGDGIEASTVTRGIVPAGLSGGSEQDSEGDLDRAPALQQALRSAKVDVVTLRQLSRRLRRVARPLETLAPPVFDPLELRQLGNLRRRHRSHSLRSPTRINDRSAQRHPDR